MTGARRCVRHLLSYLATTALVGAIGFGAAILLCGCSPKSKADSHGSAQSSSGALNEKNADLTPPRTRLSDYEIDVALQRAAASSLGDREGTVLVMDPATGRLRAVVNPRLAFEQTFPPGSAIKPFTALAAMRSGVIDSRARVLCGGTYANHDFRIVCSHPRSKTPFDLPHALGYSCNYYFAKTAERLSPSAFETVLVSYGFGRRTGVNAPESTGRIPDSGMRLKTALGEGDELLVTPIQLLRAYVGLFSGKLYRPLLERASSTHQTDASTVDISSEERATLVRGLRGAITYGTAVTAGLKSVPLFIYGKTGTSTASNGFRTQGWFVSMAAEKPDDAPMLAVLVFLKRSHGSEGAEVARGIYEEYARLIGIEPADSDSASAETSNRATDGYDRPRAESRNGDVGEGSHGGQPVQGREADAKPTNNSEWGTGYVPADASFGKTASIAQQKITVHLVSQNRTESLSLEDYILGVVLAEASVETQLEALKAQAVISRTYALKNLRRHAHDGYDFCSTTHCQRYVDPGQKPELEQLARRAVAETAGQVLVDTQGRLIDAYFGGSCGGMTADIGTLWGVPAPSYLKGVPDPYCSSMPHAHWVETISMPRLREALRSDPRTDPGVGLSNIKVARRDYTGRAEIVEIDGARRRTVSGWVFKIIVGRALGWNVLLSSRFDVERHGGDFIFRGSGFGHGLGLCQEGSHVMASRGFAYRAILSHYFPGTKIAAVPGSEVSQARSPKPDFALVRTAFTARYGSSVTLAPAAYVQERQLSSEHFRLKYSSATDRADAEAALGIFEAARRDMKSRLSAGSVQFDLDRVVDVELYGTTQEFTAATGLRWWSAGATHGTKIDLQPFKVLKRRGVATTTLRHEYAHFVIEKLSRGRAPRWLEEGLAAYFAGEGRMLESESGPRQTLTPDEIDRRLAHPGSQQEMKSLYAAAYRQVVAMAGSKSESAVWRIVAEYASDVRS